MFKSEYRKQILQIAEPYFLELENDFSHNRHHFYRVESIAKHIAESENADLEVVEASALLFDIARRMEDVGDIDDHAEEASRIAGEELIKIEFPANKIQEVQHCIFVHRRSMDRNPETLEAKILIDADYIDAMGAIDIARVIASSLTSEKYKRPIYDGKRLGYGNDKQSALHFLQYKLLHPKHNPKNFYTEIGRKIAQERYDFMKDFIDQFIFEWV